MNNGVVFNIQRFTVHDGPGIRTELFLKGCTLRCKWCGNPESYVKKPQIGVYPMKCMGVTKCGDCISVCPKGGEDVFQVEDDKVVGIDRNLCDDCLECHKECPSDALKLWGKTMSVEEAMKVIRSDKEFYKDNNGGVTISGGESLMQPEFVKEIFINCKSEGIHTCLESALHVKSEILDDVLPYTDMVITDIKQMDEAIHKEFIGAGNKQVLENVKKVVDYKIPLIVRIPVIPGFNDNKESIEAIGKFIIEELDNKILQLQMLRFRPLGEEKYASLGLEYKMEVTKERADFEDEIRSYVKMLNDMGITAYAGTTTKIEF